MPPHHDDERSPLDPPATPTAGDGANGHEEQARTLRVPPRGRAADGAGGFVLWFTGLSGAGKSTIAGLVAPELERRDLLVDSLDGDVVRTHLSRGLGFSKADRDTNIERIGWVASRLARAGATVVVSAISPYEEARRKARAMVEEHAPFIEVYVATSVEECARRDVKGLYAKALAGELAGFTGVSDPYEEPSHPELRLETEGREPAESARIVLERLEELGVVS
jgi:adenylyl-sulfate kinase